MIEVGLSNVLITFYALPFLLFFYLNYKFYKLTKNNNYLYSMFLTLVGTAFLLASLIYPLYYLSTNFPLNNTKVVISLSFTNILFLFSSIYFFASFIFYPIKSKFKVPFYISTSLSLIILSYFLTSILPLRNTLVSFSLVSFPISTLIIASSFIVISYIISKLAKENSTYLIAGAFALLNSSLYSIFSYESLILNMYTAAITFNFISYILGIIGSIVASYPIIDILYRTIKRWEIEISVKDKSIDKALCTLFKNLSKYTGKASEGIFNLAIEEFELKTGKKVLIKNNKVVNLSKAEKLELIGIFINKLNEVIGSASEIMLKHGDKTFKKVLEKVEEIERYHNKVSKVKETLIKKQRKKKRKKRRKPKT